MAGRPQNRMELRRQYEAAEPVDPMEDESDDTADDSGDDESERKPKKKPKAKAPSKAKAAKAPKPAARMRIVWAVVNDAFKTVGQTFEYSQKEAAEARAKELTEKGKGTHFVQKVKEPMPDNAPGLGAALPRVEAAPAKATAAPAKSKAKAVVVEDEEVIDDDEADDEADPEEEEEEDEEE
jgi:hypothetical protein